MKALYKPVIWLGQQYLIEFLSCHHIQATTEMALKRNANSQFKEVRSLEIGDIVKWLQWFSY